MVLPLSIVADLAHRIEVLEREPERVDVIAVAALAAGALAGEGGDALPVGLSRHHLRQRRDHLARGRREVRGAEHAADDVDAAANGSGSTASR